ncbi:MAG: LCP family protein [Eubacteriales bacterium]|nr:LCP family protein [Eubacteriales bacterium]
MKLMKKMTALLMALCLLLPGAALAEDEEISILDVVEEVNLDEGEEPAEDAEDAEGGEELFISDEVQEAMEVAENLEADIDDSINPDDLELNPNLPDNVVNILLVGVDTRSTSLDDGLQHGDVQIILSINKDTGSVKLTSILRDLYVTIPGYKSKNRINVAYSRGGGALAMRTINHTFEMNIEHYVTINFYGLASIIDAIGGVDVDLTKAEAKAINTYLKKHPPKYDNQDKEYERVPLEAVAGVQHLDGVQAVMYARTRSVDNDFGRTARQRHLLDLLLQKIMQDMTVDKLMSLMETSLPYVQTNVNASTMLSLGLSVLNSDIISRAQAGESLLGQMRIPMDDTWKYDKTEGGSSVVVFRTVARREENVQALHEFIYGQYYPASAE